MVGYSSRHRRQSSTIPVRSNGSSSSHGGGEDPRMMDSNCLFMVDSSAAFQPQQQQQQEQHYPIVPYGATQYQYHPYPPPPPPPYHHPYHPEARVSVPYHVSYHPYHPPTPSSPPPPPPPQLFYGPFPPVSPTLPASPTRTEAASLWPSSAAPPSSSPLLPPPPPLQQSHSVRFQLPTSNTTAPQQVNPSVVGLSVAAALGQDWNPQIFWYSAAELNQFRWQAQMDAQQVAMPPSSSPSPSRITIASLSRKSQNWRPTPSQDEVRYQEHAANELEDDDIFVAQDDTVSNVSTRTTKNSSCSKKNPNGALYALRRVIRNLYQACHQQVTHDDGDRETGVDPSSELELYPCMSYQDQRIVAQAPLEFWGLERWMKRLRWDKMKRLQQMHAVIREQYYYHQYRPQRPSTYSCSVPQVPLQEEPLLEQRGGDDDAYPAARRSPSPPPTPYHQLGYFLGSAEYSCQSPPTSSSSSFLDHPPSAVAAAAYGLYGTTEFHGDDERMDEDDSPSNYSTMEEAIRQECERISLPARLFAFYMANAALCK